MPVLSRPFLARRDPWAFSRSTPSSCNVPRDGVDAFPGSTPETGTTPKPASRRSPTDPTLRANPSPEVTDPICRLPLPALSRRREAVHLGDLLRIWVRPGAKITTPPSDFQGSTGAHRTSQETRRFSGTSTLSPDDPIPGTRTLAKKRQLFPGLPSTYPSSVASPR